MGMKRARQRRMEIKKVKEERRAQLRRRRRRTTKGAMTTVRKGRKKLENKRRRLKRKLEKQQIKNMNALKRNARSVADGCSLVLFVRLRRFNQQRY